MDKEKLNKQLSELPPLTLEEALIEEMGMSLEEAQQMAQFYRQFKTEKLLDKTLEDVLEIIEANENAGTASREQILNNPLLKP